MEIITTREGDIVTTTISLSNNRDFLDNADNFSDALDNAFEPDEKDIISVEFTYKYRE
jgi:hypothetical protein